MWLLQVLTMFEKADAEFAELSQKKQILHLDKDKIEKVRPAHCDGTVTTQLCKATVEMRVLRRAAFAMMSTMCGNTSCKCST